MDKKCSGCIWDSGKCPEDSENCFNYQPIPPDWTGSDQEEPRKIQVEISLCYDDDDEFEHHGYYSTIDEAINELVKLNNI